MKVLEGRKNLKSVEGSSGDALENFGDAVEHSGEAQQTFGDLSSAPTKLKK